MSAAERSSVARRGEGQRSFRAPLNAVVREPLVHFFLLGAAVFGLFALFDDTPPPTSENLLIVTEDDARRLAAEFQAVWRRPPTTDELDHVIDRYVREEVYVREALALGLDQDDAVIRRRLQTKMEFLTESGAEAVQPDDVVLQAHMESNPKRFAEPPFIAFEQIVLAEGTGEDRLAVIEANLNSGGDPTVFAAPSLLPPVFRLSPAQVIDGTFGDGFFGVLAELPEGEWTGPVETPLGRHLVRVTDRREARLPPLAEIRNRVEQDWRADLVATLREKRFEALRSRYEVVRPDAARVLAP